MHKTYKEPTTNWRSALIAFQDLISRSLLTCDVRARESRMLRFLSNAEATIDSISGRLFLLFLSRFKCKQRKKQIQFENYYRCHCNVSKPFKSMVEWIVVIHLFVFVFFFFFCNKLQMQLSIFNVEIGSRNDDTQPTEIRREKPRNCGYRRYRITVCHCTQYSVSMVINIKSWCECDDE